MTETKHTPTPLQQAHGDRAEVAYWEFDKQRASIGERMAFKKQYNRACNAHDDLVAALEWARPRLNYESISRETFGSMDKTPVDIALAKAKGDA